MTNQSIWTNKQKLDHLFDLVRSMPTDDELTAHWAQYLCVRVSGFIEDSVRLIFIRYARDKSAPFVANYVEGQINQFQNASMGKIISLAGQFCPTWESELKNNISDEMKDSVDSIVANRHQIAHGRSVGITYGTVSRYYSNVVKVITMLDGQCN